MLDPGAPSRQPTLVACMSAMLVDKPRQVMRPESAFTISAFLMAYTNELDRQLRGVELGAFSVDGGGGVEESRGMKIPGLIAAGCVLV